MNDWGKGLVLFSALLSPLAMADWLLDVNFELSCTNSTRSVNTSLSLLPGEETVCFDMNESSAGGGSLIGSAELLEVSADEIKIAFKVEERLEDGLVRTIMSPIISTGLNSPISFETLDATSQQQAKLQIAVTSV